MDHYIIQFYEKSDVELITSVKKTLRYFMVDKSAPIIKLDIISNDSQNGYV